MTEKKVTGKAAQASVDGAETVTLPEMVRRVLLASVGAVVLTQEEIEKFVGRLVDKGEIAERDGKKMVRDILERRKATIEKAEEEVDDRVERVLDRMNVPSKRDIDDLSKKILELSKKVDELRKEREDAIRGNGKGY